MPYVYLENLGTVMECMTRGVTIYDNSDSVGLDG
jgi:hypothetical protein